MIIKQKSDIYCIIGIENSHKVFRMNHAIFDRIRRTQVVIKGVRWSSSIVVATLIKGAHVSRGSNSIFLTHSHWWEMLNVDITVTTSSNLGVHVWCIFEELGTAGFAFSIWKRKRYEKYPVLFIFISHLYTGYFSYRFLFRECKTRSPKFFKDTSNMNT